MRLQLRIGQTRQQWDFECKRNNQNQSSFWGANEQVCKWSAIKKSCNVLFRNANNILESILIHHSLLLLLPPPSSSYSSLEASLCWAIEARSYWRLLIQFDLKQNLATLTTIYIERKKEKDNASNNNSYNNNSNNNNDDNKALPPQMAETSQSQLLLPPIRLISAITRLNLYANFRLQIQRAASLLLLFLF